MLRHRARPAAGRWPVAEARQQAFEAYQRAGLPHRRIEDWKYTDLRVLMREVLPLAAAAGRCGAGARRRGVEAACHRGRAPAGAGRRGVCAPSCPKLAVRKRAGHPHAARGAGSRDCCAQPQLFATGNSDAMVALNSAMMTDGLVIEVADGTALTQPLHIVHIASGARARGDVHALAAAASATVQARRWWKAISPLRAPKPIRSMTRWSLADRRRRAA